LALHNDIEKQSRSSKKLAEAETAGKQFGYCCLRYRSELIHRYIKFRVAHCIIAIYPSVLKQQTKKVKNKN